MNFVLHFVFLFNQFNSANKVKLKVFIHSVVIDTARIS